MDRRLIQGLLNRTEIVRAPTRMLSTFGATTIDYHLVSSVEDLPDRTRLREGKVVSRRPQILTPEAFRERFEGFGPEAAEFAQWLAQSYREFLRSLEYNFHHEGFSTRVLRDPPRAVADRIAADLDAHDQRGETVIACPDAAWSLALMKFTLDESSRSFPTHVRDLERRGLFGPRRNP